MTEIFHEALGHFKRLIQFNTTNPPGNELEAIEYVRDILVKEGLKPVVIKSAERRANLVVKIEGDGTGKPLMIMSHIDVVHAEAEKWKYPPFSAVEAEGCIWGRGAIDMKNMTAYCLATVLAVARAQRLGSAAIAGASPKQLNSDTAQGTASRQKEAGTKLKRDLIMVVVADEEVGGDFGMGYLAKNHPDLITSEYALGELGGYTVHMNGRRVYPVQVGEKGIFWIKIHFHGNPGHGSIPTFENAHYKLGQFLWRLRHSYMPVHMTDSTAAFLNKMEAQAGWPQKIQYKLLRSQAGPRILKKIASKSSEPEKFHAIAAMLTNTANPTGVEGGYQHNVVPSRVTLKLDCRLLPGFSGADFIGELEAVAGEKLDIEVVSEAHGHESTFDTPLFREIEKQLQSADPGSFVVPNLTVGFTDAQHLKKLGTICYGFTPVKLPEGLNFPKLYHGHDERIPVEGFRWGLDVFMKTVIDFCSK